MSLGNVSSSQMGGVGLDMLNSRPTSASLNMSVDTGGTFSNTGNRLGLAQTPSGGGGGFNFGGMAGVGRGGALGWQNK